MENYDQFQEKVEALASEFNRDSRMMPFQLVISLRIAYSIFGSDFEPFVGSVVRAATHYEIALRLFREDEGQRTIIHMWCHIPHVSTDRTFIRYSHHGTYRSDEKEDVQEFDLDIKARGLFYPEIMELFWMINVEDDEDIKRVIQEEDDMYEEVHAVYDMVAPDAE